MPYAKDQQGLDRPVKAKPIRKVSLASVPNTIPAKQVRSPTLTAIVGSHSFRSYLGPPSPPPHLDTNERATQCCPSLDNIYFSFMTAKSFLSPTLCLLSPSYVDFFIPLNSIGQNYNPVRSHLKKAARNS